MTLTSLLGIAGPLALVLGLILLAAAVLRRVRHGQSPASRTRPRLEVLQRVALGPKQGLALVRIGDQEFAVGLGDVSSITRVSDLPRTATSSPPLRPSAPVHAVSAAPAGPRPPAMAPAGRPAATAAPRAALRGAVMIGALLGPAAGEIGAQAQTGSANAATTAAPVPAQAAVPSAPVVARPRGPERAATAAPAAAQVTPATPTSPQAAGAPTPRTDAAAPVPPAASPASAIRTTEQVIQRLSPQMDVRMGGGDGLRLSGTVGVVVMMGLLTLLPTMLLLMTGFARVLIVLGFVRQAIGAQSAPPAQLLTALALLLTGFVMAPTIEEANRTALQPWLAGQIEQAEMMEAAVKPFRAFMLRQTRDKDLQTFLELSGAPTPERAEDVPLVVLASAFTTSELRTAFQMGFAVFLPFIVVDMVVSSVLMSMGMYMLPPAMVALPFKLLLFVLVDGWTLVVQSLVQSFR